MSAQGPPEDYQFPHDRLVRTLRNPAKEPVVLVACGSFSPVTYLHLRMFEMAVDYVRQNTNFEIMGGYLSPVSDMYKKPGLLSAEHRVTMCNIAATLESSWIMVDPWEAFQAYQRTAVVLDHFDYEINEVLGGVETEDGERRRVHVMLLAGSDLISTMSEPGVWSEEDLDHILGRYGCFIIERAGSDIAQATDALAKWRHNIYFVSQMIQNDVSSTKVRLFLRRGLSVRYLLPTPVIEYIEQNGLYLDDGPNHTNAHYRQQIYRDCEKPSSSSSSSSTTSQSTAMS
ncbi:Nucleotidylyl transferase [Fomitiporia mediterranea MF3/22]|uniref:Nucleotidylyl transferase n=1 Tax=Fomitiporia mediterranea (strain MF3/22) TaxID=694068 RepID=UPI00044085DB|nr:Nucleotidylyl transferase [Fomitiporia mediterranea MF3/22]EJD08410.1 Nucleotidylyl transferase [Fomitiporia mediterranea MF3/22]